MTCNRSLRVARGLAVVTVLTWPVAAQEANFKVPCSSGFRAVMEELVPQFERAPALHIMKDLLQCNHWDQVDRWLTGRYVQHNPRVVSGRDAVVKFFGSPSKTPTCVENLHVDLVRHVGFVDGKADERWDPAQKS